jgi:methylase of polypeptide subunit release factors
MRVPAGEPTVYVLARLLDRLRAAGYTDAGLRAAMDGQPELPAVPTRVDALAIDDRTLGALVKLFLFTDDVEVLQVQKAISPDLLDELVQNGVLTREGSRIRGLVTIFPYDGLLVVADVPSYAAADFVNGPGPSAITLAGLTVRRQVGSALDLGTGSGFQALLTARHSSAVVAVDVTPRAVAYAELNARLNGVTNLDCRTGSWFDPVQGAEFDLVVANPPFVISPESHWIFRDSGPSGDAVCRQLIQEVPGYLRHGGIAHIMCNWVHSGDDDWLDPIRGWVQGRGCDVIVIHHASLDPVRYAATWNAELALRDPSEQERKVRAWAAHYEAHSIHKIATGIIILRRGVADSTWIHALQMPGPVRGSASDQLLRVFAGRDFLRSHRDPTALLGHAYELVDCHRVEQTMLYRDGGYTAQEPAIMLERGMPVATRLDPEAVHVLFRLEGSRPVSDIVTETARETGFDATSLAEKSTAMIRELLGAGFLVAA